MKIYKYDPNLFPRLRRSQFSSNMMIPTESRRCRNNCFNTSITSGCDLFVETKITELMPICVNGFISESFPSIRWSIVNLNDGGTIVSRLPIPEAKLMIHGGWMRLGLDSQYLRSSYHMNYKLLYSFLCFLNVSWDRGSVWRLTRR